MKTKIWLGILLSFAITMSYIPAFAVHPDCEIGDSGIVDLEDQIECAIEKGLEYISGTQPESGGWDDTYTTLAATGLMCVKYIDRAKELELDPFDNAEYEYADNLILAINHIAGNIIPGDAGELKTNNPSTTYTTGIADMCFSAAAEIDPDRTATIGTGLKTYEEIVQGLNNWIIGNQQTTGCAEGGWNYQEKESDLSWADNSISGYATMGLGFAQSLADVTIPPANLNHLDAFIDAVQQSGGTYDGGSDYHACYANNVINTLKTGNLLYEICLVEDAQGSSRVDRALTFLETYWGNLASVSNGGGWRGNYQAMFTMMKGLEGCGVELLDLGGGGGRDDDWFVEVAQWIVDDQETNGSFIQNTGRGSLPLNSGWALLTLERAVQRIEFGIPAQCVLYGEAFASFDADDYVVVGTPPYTWTWTGETDLIVEKDIANVFTIDYLEGWVGSETINFTATDGNMKTSDDLATFTVDPVPDIDDIPDQTAPFTAFDLDDYLISPVPSLVTWSYSENVCIGVSIDVDNVVTITNPGNACQDPETVTFTAAATACDEEVSDSETAVFTPNQPPDCLEATPSFDTIWPPNHKFVSIKVMGVTDPDGDPVSITIDSIYQDEPVDTFGDGSFTPDGQGVGTETAEVRAERSGTKKVPGNGRVYHISFTSDDGRGGSCSGEVLVGVPHDQGLGSIPIDEGPLYDSTALSP